MDSRALLVHGNPANLRALEAGLRGEGFDVQTASTGAEAWTSFQTNRPSLIVTDTEVGELDGFALTTRLREDAVGRNVAVIVLDANATPGRRLRATQAGADSRLVSADPTKEVMARARLLFGSPKRDAESPTASAPRGFACDVADLDVLDLVALVHRNGRSGVGHLTAPGRATGSLFFDQGRLIDAQAGHVSGFEAFYRLTCWTGGALNLEWRNFRRRDVLGRAPAELIGLGLKHLDEWTQLLGRLAAPNAVFRVDLDALIDRLSSTFGQLTEVLNACDGVRNVVQIVDECGIGDLEVLRTLIQLRDEGLISDPSQPLHPAVPPSTGGAPSSPAAVEPPASVKQPSPPSTSPRPPTTQPEPRNDFVPSGSARHTAPLGQVGLLPVSRAESRKLPAVTMQFPSMPPAPRPGAPVAETTPAQPPTPDAPAQAPAQPALAQPPSKAPDAPAQSHPAHTIAWAPPRPAAPRPAPLDQAQPPAPAAWAPPQPAQPPAPEVVAPAQPPLPAEPQQRQLVLARPEAEQGSPAPSDGTSTEPSFKGSHDAEQRRPWWDRRNERPPERTVAADPPWNPVWPQSSSPPPEPTTALVRVERDAPLTAVESPTVYLPARAPERPPARARPAYSEGIRRKPADRGKPAPRAKPTERAKPVPHAKPNRLRHQATAARPHVAWLVGGAALLLGALTAIGVALMRAIVR